MPASLCSGLIALIPKGGDAADLRQWRPITLLSSIYKILARLLSMRLQPFMSDIIHDTQTAFIQNRCILDNVFTFYATVEHARSSHQPTTILLLDLEKAFEF